MRLGLRPALADGRDEFFPDAIRRAVIEGNLEAVLDEHFWFLAKAGAGDWKERLIELEGALRLRASNVVLHESGPGSEPMRLRCHAAVPLNEVRVGGGRGAEALPDLETAQEERPLRPDEVRRAFNTPFLAARPHHDLDRAGRVRLPLVVSCACALGPLFRTRGT